MFGALAAEVTITCPYNRSHRIGKYRMAHHLVKCRKSYPDVDIVVCPFNSVHRVPLPELELHTETCPDKKILERLIYDQTTTEEVEEEKPEPVSPPKPHFQHYNSPAADDDEEDWSNCDAPSYDPQQAIVNRNVLRRLDVASSATRKAFRITERQRLQNLEMEEQKKLYDFPDDFGSVSSAKSARRNNDLVGLPPPLNDNLGDSSGSGSDAHVESNYNEWKEVRATGRGRGRNTRRRE